MANTQEWKHKWVGQTAWAILTSALIYLSFYKHVAAWVAVVAFLVLLWSFKSHPKVRARLNNVAFRFQWPIISKKKWAKRRTPQLDSLTLVEGQSIAAAIGARGKTYLLHVVAPPDPLQIISAHYGANHTYRDVTANVEQRVENGRLHLWVGNTELGGDPLSGVGKRLEVKYRFNGKDGFDSFDESTFADLPPAL